MTQGFLLFAHNNEEIEYGLMAVWSARRIAKWLGKPVSLVTDEQTCESLTAKLPGWEQSFDRVIKQPSTATQTKRYVDRQLTFHNLDRTSAWDLTPYDETIVIDTDVLVQSTNLNKLWNSEHDLLVCKTSKNLFGRTDPEFEYISETSIKFFWATVFYFRKTQFTKMFFDLCKDIKRTYNVHRTIYSLLAGPIRNDFIWSIALHTLSYEQELLIDLLYSLPTDSLIKLTENDAVILSNCDLCKIKGLDLHIMNKFDLMKQIEKELL
jgi:hypothetical protein